MKKFIISIDQGTTSSRAILFDSKAKIVFKSQFEFKQYFPKNGWVEHNPKEIWLTTIKALKNVIKKLVSDGVLVSTPAGSTAYNLSVHGPILSLNSKKLSISPISPFRPRRWKGKIVSDSSKIIIKNLINFILWILD